MSYTVNQLVACENIQAQLNELFFGAGSRQYVEANPFLDYIVSEENTTGVLQEPMTALGKLKGVTVKYFQRYLETDSDFQGSNTNNCGTGGELTENFYTYELSENQGDSIIKSIPLTDLINSCESDQFYAAKQIQMMINVLERKINTDAIATAATLTGNFASSGTSTAIVTNTKNSDGAYVTDLIEDVEYEFIDMDYTDKIITVGGSKDWSQYWSSIGAGCCIDKKGIDQGLIAEGSRIMPIYDRKVETGLGANQFFAFAPRAIQMLGFNRYGGDIARTMTTELEKYGTVTSPFSGITYDYWAKYDCETWKFFVGKTYDFVVAPDDMFKVGDRMEGVNLFNEFQITNP